MKLPLSWLKEYVKVAIDAEKLAEKLTMAGLEVESIDSNINFSGVVIGEVLEREKHPNADKLNVAKVNVGKKTLQIVCGAPNLNVGQRVPVALVGAKLGDFEIGKANLRGIESNGMICSEKELGLGEDHAGIMVLEKNAPVGESFAKFLKTEKVIDIKIFANRPDLMGIIGLSRETAAILNEKLNLPKVEFKPTAKCKVQELVSVDIKNFELCPKYVARVVQNVKITPSPTWMQERLISCGVRPINNLVDISNYVMLEYGQPLHFFDYKKVVGSQKLANIIVRNAKKDEKLTTLDGVERKLTEQMLVIADKNKAIALAGVMGGENTEVDDKTTEVLVEAAVFDRANIRRTSRSLGLRSEAVARFEKGIPLRMPEEAIDRAVQLLIQLADGKACDGKVITATKELQKTKITLETDRVNGFLGIKLSTADIAKVLEKLGFLVTEKGQKLDVVVPWWRPDIESVADLYEEVARMWGYDRLPSTLPGTGARVPKENNILNLDNKIKYFLSDIGFSEVYTYSFITGKDLTRVGENIEEAPKVANPLVSDQEYMRSSLVPSMLKALSENQFNKESVRFFEIGKTFRNQKNKVLPLEKRFLCVSVIGGTSWPINYEKGENFYQLKGVLEALLGKLKLDTQLIDVKRTSNKLFITGRGAEVSIKGQVFAVLGEVDKKILASFDLKREAGILYIDLEKIGDLAEAICYTEFSKYPKVVRDISAIVNQKVEIGVLRNKLFNLNDLIYNVEVIDIYQGKPLQETQRSVTYRVNFVSNEKTLTEEEVDKVYNLCKKEIKNIGGKIRGESNPTS